MASPKNIKFEFVNDDARQSQITQRLGAIEQEVLNAQIDLTLEKAVADAAGDTPITSGAPGSASLVEQREAALNAAVARLEALRALRDGSGSAAKA